MKIILCAICALTVVACSQSDAASSEGHDLIRDAFYKQQESLMEEHRAMLVKSGHMEKDFGDVSTVMGIYDWHSGSHEYFGAYSFSQSAFDQARHAWFGHFKILEGSRELQTTDFCEDSHGGIDDAHGTGCIRFDQSAIGLTIPPMSMFWVDRDDHTADAWFSGAKVVAVKDYGRTLVLDKRAPHQAEQWGMEILPDNWVDMCACYVGSQTVHTAQSLAISGQ